MQHELFTHCIINVVNLYKKKNSQNYEAVLVYIPVMHAEHCAHYQHLFVNYFWKHYYDDYD